MAERSPEEPGGTTESRPADIPSPIDATLRILQASMPFLIGAAVVRQGGETSIVGQVGRVPWLFDRRLTQLELSDDALPPNQPVLLDWPVPHQAEWIGVAPRLLIGRLVAADRTVGVLLGTLLSREQLPEKMREAVDLSCQLIASAVATDALVRDTELQSRRLRVLNELQRALSSSLDARALGRILREAMTGVIEHIGFSVSLFHPQRGEVAYRYRVVDVDALSQDASRPLDDGPACRAAREAHRVVFAREVDVPAVDGKASRRQVGVAQFPLLQAGAPIGVVTLQAFRPDGFGEEELALAEVVVETSANYFAHARRVGLRRPEPEEPKFTLVTGTGPVAPAAEEPPSAPAVAAAAPVSAAPATARAPAADAPHQPAPAARAETLMPSSAERGAEQILRDLLGRASASGAANALVLLVDEGAGLIRGVAATPTPFMSELDRTLGIAKGTFLIGVEDRANAIARACRETRSVNVSWLYEALQPVLGWQEALTLERLAGGGRCTVFPLVAGGGALAALVVGPSAEDLSRGTFDELGIAVEAAARELESVWRAAASTGESFAPGMSEESVLRLSALRNLGS